MMPKYKVQEPINYFIGEKIIIMTKKEFINKIQQIKKLPYSESEMNIKLYEIYDEYCSQNQEEIGNILFDEITKNFATIEDIKFGDKVSFSEKMEKNNEA